MLSTREPNLEESGPGQRGRGSWLTRLAARLPIGVKLAVPLVLGTVGVVSGLGWWLYEGEAKRISRDFESDAILIGEGVQETVNTLGESGASEAEVEAGVAHHIGALVGLDRSIFLIDIVQFEDGEAEIRHSSHDWRVGATDALPDDISEDVNAILVGDEPVRLDPEEEVVLGTNAIEARVPLFLGDEPNLLQIYISTEERDRALATLLRNVAIAAGGTGLLVPVLVMAAIYVIVARNERRLIEATERIKEGDYSARVKGVVVDKPADDILRFSAIFNRMAERIQQLHERLAERATTDELTGAYNRGYVMDCLQGEVRQAERGNPLSLILVDVDMLKELNDRCGHGSGDDALRVVAHALRSTLRESDIMGRFGGDEFLILLPDCAGAALSAALNRVHAELAALKVMCGRDGRTLPVTISAGGAVLQRGEAAQSFLGRADLALYEAKAGGRNQTRMAA